MSTEADSNTGVSKLERYKSFLGLSVVVLLHCILQWPHLNLDFWNDELYTLEHFVFRPVEDIITDYHAPNNHILFSLLVHYWTKIIDVPDFQQAISNPWPLRLLPFVCSMLTVLVTYQTAYRIAGRWAALSAAAILVTTIPFYNYAAQLRGYSLSMLLAALTLATVLIAFQERRFINYCLITVLSAASVYTLPTNLYFIVALSLSIPLLARRPGLQQAKTQRSYLIPIVAALFSGIVVAMLLYWPVLQQMRAKPSLQNTQVTDAFPLLTAELPLFTFQLIAARYFLVIAMALSFMLLALHNRRLLTLYSLLLCILLAVPFLLSDLLLIVPPTRIFLTIVPILCVLIACSITSAFQHISKLQRQPLITVALCIYCVIICIGQIQKLRIQTASDISRGIRSGDLYIQYNLNFFQPAADAWVYWQQHHSPSIPLVEACRMDEELLKYLSWQGWSRPLNNQHALTSALEDFDTVDILIERPADFLDTFKRAHPYSTAQVLLPGPRQVQVLRVMK